MKQTFLILAIAIGLTSCKQSNNKLLGSWDNKDGQILEFNNDGTALWVFYTETDRDTFEIRYTFDHSTTQNQLDLTGFSVGPLTGKTLYGIVEFRGNDTFRFDCEPSVEDRPKTFSSDQTQTYYRQQQK